MPVSLPSIISETEALGIASCDTMNLDTGDISNTGKSTAAQTDETSAAAQTVAIDAASECFKELGDLTQLMIPIVAELRSIVARVNAKLKPFEDAVERAEAEQTQISNSNGWYSDAISDQNTIASNAQDVIDGLDPADPGYADDVAAQQSIIDAANDQISEYNGELGILNGDYAADWEEQRAYHQATVTNIINTFNSIMSPVASAFSTANSAITTANSNIATGKEGMLDAAADIAKNIAKTAGKAITEAIGDIAENSNIMEKSEPRSGIEPKPELFDTVTLTNIRYNRTSQIRVDVEELKTVFGADNPKLLYGLRLGSPFEIGSKVNNSHTLFSNESGFDPYYRFSVTNTGNTTILKDQKFQIEGEELQEPFIATDEVLTYSFLTKFQTDVAADAVSPSERLVRVNDTNGGELFIVAGVNYLPVNEWEEEWNKRTGTRVDVEDAYNVTNNIQGVRKTPVDGSSDVPSGIPTYSEPSKSKSISVGGKTLSLGPMNPTTDIIAGADSNERSFKEHYDKMIPFGPIVENNRKAAVADTAGLGGFDADLVNAAKSAKAAEADVKQQIAEAKNEAEYNKFDFVKVTSNMISNVANSAASTAKSLADAGASLLDNARDLIISRCNTAFPLFESLIARTEPPILANPSPDITGGARISGSYSSDGVDRTGGYL